MASAHRAGAMVKQMFDFNAFVRIEIIFRECKWILYHKPFVNIRQNPAI